MQHGQTQPGGLTAQQNAAIRAPGNVFLISCPGSGKTRAIVAKLMRCIEDVRKSTRRVACITHTNAGADEIDIRLRRLCTSGEDCYYETATIHSFALRHILEPFHKSLAEFAHGFEIVTSDSEVYQERRSDLIRRHSLNPRCADSFENIQRGPGGALFAPDDIPLSVAAEWCEWLDRNAYITLNDIVYHACRLLECKPHLTSALASHYAWILVDEFQDSSPGQIHLLKQIHRFGRTNFFCVGDPNQSIFGFAGACPQLLYGFAKHISADMGHTLSANFRSSAQVVAAAERLCPTTPVMYAAGEYRNWPSVPQYHHTATRSQGILEIFLPAVRSLAVPLGEVAVLAPWWLALFHLARELRSNGIPVVGPGARPYKRGHVFSQLAEPMGAYLESPEPDIARAVQRALFYVLLEITGQPDFRVYAFRGRVVVCELLIRAKEAMERCGLAHDWLHCAAESIAAVLVRSDFLPSASVRPLCDSASAMASEIAERDSAGNLRIQDLGIFARPKHCIQLLTIHKAKGREFEAVAVIDAHDGRLPHFSVSRTTDPVLRHAKYDEARRLTYVAATRAKRLLMFFTDGEDFRNRPSPFLEELGLV